MTRLDAINSRLSSKLASENHFAARLPHSRLKAGIEMFHRQWTKRCVSNRWCLGAVQSRDTAGVVTFCHLKINGI